MAPSLFLLFESASGYALFLRNEADETALELVDVQRRCIDASMFARMVHFRALMPFRSAADALEQANAVSEGICSPLLQEFLKANLPTIRKKGKKQKFQLGVIDEKLAASISDSLGMACTRVRAHVGPGDALLMLRATVCTVYVRTCIHRSAW